MLLLILSQRKLELDRRAVRYIPQGRDLDMLTYDSLILGKKMGVVEPATYVDTTFCQREVLERLMEVKVFFLNSKFGIRILIKM